MSHTIDWTTFEDIASAVSYESIVSRCSAIGSYRFGKLAVVNLVDLQVSSQPGDTQILATGLPQPTANIEVIMVGGTTGKAFRCRFTVRGELTCWYPGSVDLSELYYLNFIYKTN